MKNWLLNRHIENKMEKPPLRKCCHCQGWSHGKIFCSDKEYEQCAKIAQREKKYTTL